MARAAIKIITVDTHEPDMEVIEQAAQVIREGGLVVLPTDTVYGLVCDPSRKEAVERIYQIKKRRRDQPLVLLLHDMVQVEAFIGEAPPLAVRAMQEFWPGALTIIFRDRGEATANVRAGGNTVGFRLPAHVVPWAVSQSLGFALASTSANLSGEPPPITADDAARQLGSKVDLYLDSGPCPTGQESSIVSFAEDPPRLLRAGPISLPRLREVLGEVQEAS